MKKILNILLIIIIATTLTACSEPKKTTECFVEIEDTDNGFKTTSKIELTYRGEVVTFVKSKETIESDNPEILEYFSQMIESVYALLGELEHYDYEKTMDTDKLTVNASIDYTQIDIDKLKALDVSVNALFNDEDEPLYTRFIQLYEQMGGTCTEVE